MKNGWEGFSLCVSRMNFSVWVTEDSPPLGISFLPEPLNVA